jgi:hypothetical protein
MEIPTQIQVVSPQTSIIRLFDIGRSIVQTICLFTFLLLTLHFAHTATAFSGAKSSVQVKFTPVRVVCQNTLTIALSDGAVYRVVHHADIHSKLQQAIKCWV